MSLGLILGPVLFNVFMENLVVKEESTLGMLTGNTTSEKEADILEGEAAV